MADGIYFAVTGAVSQLQSLDVVSNNLANMNTAGFKGDQTAFSELLAQASARPKLERASYVEVAEVRTDLRGGTLRATENPQDIALQGPGYIALQQGDEFVYSRAGNLHLTSDGTLIDPSGATVLDNSDRPLKLNLTDGVIQVAQDGTVSQNGKSVGQIKVVEFEKPEMLERLGNTLYRAPEELTAEKNKTTKVHQGYLELSNVNGVTSMSTMITAHRAYDTFHRVISMFNQIDRRTATSVGDDR